MPDRISFTRPAVERIANVVRAVENARPAAAGLRSRAVVAAGKPKGIERGTFTAPWPKGTTKTITDATTAGKTYTNVKNYFAAITGTGTKACAIAYVGTEWILIAAEC
jgi:hypothetical protein